MFAKSEKITAVGGEHIPLFAKQTPLPVTTTATAKNDLPQYQLGILQNNGEITVEAGLFNSPLDNTTQLCVTAFPAKANEKVSVYTHGTFNINALVLPAGMFSSGDSIERKLMILRKMNSSVIFFENCETNPVQRT